MCTRIWMELEALGQAAGQGEGRPPQDLLMSTAILRLELVILVDYCRSQRWRHMLSREQRDSMCSLLTDLLAALYVDLEQLSTGIAEAQGRVLSSLIEAQSTRCSSATVNAIHLLRSSSEVSHGYISLRRIYSGLHAEP